jgi:TonB family protein
MNWKHACCLVVLVVGVTSPAAAQLTHFVSPTYVSLARQAGISGQVELKATIAKDGTLMALVAAPAHPLLAQEAKASVREWKFQPGSEERTIAITLDYRFSDETREYPRTLVQADFAPSSIHVVVTTDHSPPNPGTVSPKK